MSDTIILDTQRGYTKTGEGEYACLSCDARFQKGEVYPMEGKFYEAERAVAAHVQAQHGDRFEALLAEENPHLSLTDHQKNLLAMLYSGLSDNQIASQTGVSASTVRRQRYMFREKAKRARAYLALYGLLEERRGEGGREGLLPLYAGEAKIDDRFLITREENEKILKSAFESLSPLRLRKLPVKEKKKVAVLAKIMEELPTQEYTEKELAKKLKPICGEDHVTVRRLLVDYRFLARTTDGARYWVLEEKR